MVKIETHVVGPLQTNCYLIILPSNRVLMIDPGGPEVEIIAKQVKTDGQIISDILVTHAHFDHYNWGKLVKNIFEKAKIWIGEEDSKILPEIFDWGNNFNISTPQYFDPDELIQKNTTLEFDNLSLTCIDSPGHTPGSTVYFLKEMKVAFTGDVLFKQSIGRTDFPFCDPGDMESTLLHLTKILPDETRILPGHGESTSMGEEKSSNPFLISLSRGLNIF